MYVGAAQGTSLLRASQAILKLPRPTKRLIMVAADAVMLPAALLLALALKFGRIVEPTRAGCAIGLRGRLRRRGLFRGWASIRPSSVSWAYKAAGRMVMGVTLSVLCLGACAAFGLSSAGSRFGSGNLLGSRAAIRGRQPLPGSVPLPLQRQAALRQAGGDLWRRRSRCPYLSGADGRARFRACRVRRRPARLARQSDQRARRLRSRGSSAPGRDPQDRSCPAGDAFRFAPSQA